MQIIYVEKSIKHHPRTKRILERFGVHAKVIECEHYREVFNPKSQNFRVQKQNPALILAAKPGNLVLPTPEGFGIGGSQNYYFSHMLNCMYDCRYCFLQGMYNSANYVVFINYEEFMQAIADVISQSSDDNKIYFFSGYDADSLAYEPVTGFLEAFLPFFAKYPQAILEIRTKSANVNAILSQPVVANAVIAFSFTPTEISEAVEHKVPSVAKRIVAMKALAEKGWSIGLRLDPLIYASNFDELYAQLIDSIFAQVPINAIHSVSVGPLRFPAKMYQKLVSLYPKDKLLAHPLQRRQKNYTYSEAHEKEMKAFVLNHMAKYVPETLIFECQT